MIKAELVMKMAEKAGLSKVDTTKALDAFMETVKEELTKGNSVILAGFATFEVKNTKERVGRNPRTGEQVKIEASKRVHIKVGKNLKETQKK